MVSKEKVRLNKKHSVSPIKKIKIYNTKGVEDTPNNKKIYKARVHSVTPIANYKSGKPTF